MAAASRIAQRRTSVTRHARSLNRIFCVRAAAGIVACEIPSPRGPWVSTPNEPGPDIGRLLLRCHDRPGIIAAVSAFLSQAGANIISLDQHSTAPEDGTFLQRAIFHLPGLTAAIDGLEREFAATVADKFGIDYRFTEAAKPSGSPSWRPRMITAC